MPLLTDSLTIPPASSLNSTGKSAAARQLPAAAERAVVPLVYGEDRISGLILNVLSAAGTPGTLLVQVLWCHACDSVNDVRLNDQALPAGASITHYTGAQTSTDATLAAAFAAQGITGVRPLTGYAWSLLAMPAALFDGQVNVTARIRGRRCYDPAFDSTAGGVGPQRLADATTWAYTDIPAVCLGDFLASTVYGCGVAVNWDSVRITSAANRVIVPGSSEQRRLVGVSFTSPAAASDVAETLRAYACCYLLPSASGVRLLPDQDDSPVAAYRHADGQIASIEALELRDLGQAPTAVEVIYTDRSAIPWRDASAIAQLDGAGTTKPWRLSQVRLPGVHRYGQAKREATERLNKLVLNDITTVLEVHDIGIKHEQGDIITVTHPLGLSETAMRVSGPPTMPAPGRWRLPLVRHSAAAYSDIVASAAAIQDAQRIVPALTNGSSGAMNADPGLLEGSKAWVWDGPIYVAGPSTDIGALGVKYFAIDGFSGGNKFAWSQQMFPISAARSYNYSALLNVATGNDRDMYLVVDMYKSDGTRLSGADTGWGGAYAGYTFGSTPTADGAWRRYGGDFGAGTSRPIPAVAAYCRIGVWFQYADGAGSSSVQQAAEDLRLVDVTDARLASAAAATAQGTANTAATNAGNALSTLSTMRSNGYIDASEKPALIKAWQAIYDEQGGIYGQGTAYGLTSLRDAYSSAFNALASYLGGLSPSWNDTTTDTPITPATDQSTWAAYYSARQTLLNAIADETAKRAQWNQVGGSGKPLDNAGRTLDLGTGTHFGARNRDDAPGEYPYGRSQQFKQASSIGLSSGDGMYCTLETVIQYTDDTGGPNVQYAYQGDKTWRRSALRSASSWGAWTQDLDRNAYTGSLTATTNNVTYSMSAPVSAVDGDIWVDLSTTPSRIKLRVGGNWQSGATLTTNTNQLTDGANLGSTAVWGMVSGTGKPADSATKNVLTRSTSAPSSPTDGDLWCDTSLTPNVWKVRLGGTWQPAASYVTNTADIVDGANLGLTAVWTGVTGTGKPADNATRNYTYSQSGDPVSSPGGVVNGETWLQTSTGKTFVRVSGAWVAVVGTGSVNTNELADQAATVVAVFSDTGVTYSNIG